MALLELTDSSQFGALQPRDELLLGPVAPQYPVVETYLFFRQEAPIRRL